MRQRAAPRDTPRSRCRASADRLRQTPSACAFLANDVPTEVLFCCQLIVGTAAQREVVDIRWTSPGMRMLVMELEPGLLSTPVTAGIHIRATRFVPLPDTATDFCSDVPTLL